MAKLHFNLQNKGDRKYGLRRILKQEFNINPNRFELRIGFPDAPLCPYGNHFSALGFDLSYAEYVWFSKGILKDERLIKVVFKNKKLRL